MILEIENVQEEIPYNDEMRKILETCAEKTLKIERFNSLVEISVTLMNNKQIRQLNKEYRGIDQETDVLSFPMIDFQGEQGEWDMEALRNDIDPENQAVILGDIVISMEKASRQAEEYGHSFSRELGFLMVHSMMHLLGYDHEDEEDAKIMREHEEAVLSGLNLTR